MAEGQLGFVGRRVRWVGVLVYAVLLCGVLCARGPTAHAQEPAATDTKPTAKIDTKTEPLPKFAVARYGSNRFITDPTSVAYADACNAYVGYRNGILRLWDTCKKELLWETQPAHSDISVYLSPDNKTLLVIDGLETFQIWDTSTRSMRSSVSDPGKVRQAVQITTAGFLTKTETHLYLRSYDDGRIVSQYTRASTENRELFYGNITLSPDTMRAAWFELTPSGSVLKTALVSNLSITQTLLDVKGGWYSSFFAFSPDSKTLAVVSNESDTHGANGDDEAIVPSLTIDLWPMGDDPKQSTFTINFPEDEGHDIDWNKDLNEGLTFSEDSARLRVQGSFFTDTEMRDSVREDFGKLDIEVALATTKQVAPDPKTRWQKIPPAPTTEDIPALSSPNQFAGVDYIGFLNVARDGRSFTTHRASEFVRWKLPEGEPISKKTIAASYFSYSNSALSADGASAIEVVHGTLASDPNSDCSTEYEEDPTPPAAYNGEVRVWSFDAKEPKVLVSDPRLLAENPIVDPDGEHVWVCRTRRSTYEADCGEERGDYAHFMERISLKGEKSVALKAALPNCPIQSPTSISIQSQRVVTFSPPVETKLNADGFYPEDFDIYGPRVVKVFDLASGEALFVSKESSSDVSGALSPDGQHLSYAIDGATILARVSDGSVTHLGKMGRRLLFSADSRLLLVVKDRDIVAIDVNNPQPAKHITLSGHLYNITAFDLSTDNRLFTAQSDGVVYVWDLNAVAGEAPPPAPATP